MALAGAEGIAKGAKNFGRPPLPTRLMAAIGETDPAKLKKFALHATRATGLGKNPVVRKAARRSEVAASA